MKKLILVSFIILGVAACTDKNSYQVIGTVEGSSNGDTVFMQEIVGRDFHKVDTAVIIDGKFTFNGRQDSAINRYMTYMKNNNGYATDFFLENGTINIALGKNSSVSGTEHNNIYQTFKNKQNTLEEEEYEIYQSLQDTTLTEEQQATRRAAIGAKETELTDLVTQTIKENIANPVGAHLLSRYNFIIEYEDLEPLLEQLPAKYQGNERISKLKDQVEIAKNSAIGKQFIDLEMKNPEGKMVKLSDYIDKNKYTLIDFWASWCGPCRAEMPELVKLYAEYKDKGFEIVGISLDRDQSAWENGIKVLGITWPQMSDLKFWNSKGAELYAVRSIPYTVLVSQDGTIIDRNLRGEALEDKLTDLFNQ